MPETGTNILSYSGNAALGASGDIPVINPNNNLSTINDAARNIMMLNHDNNINLYNQKIKDRDTTLQMIQQGEIASGKIDPNDRPVYDKARKDVEDSFFNMMNNGGLNNRDAAKDYYDKVANLKNVTDWAQSRELGLTQLQQERANQVLPEDQKLYDNHIAEMKKQPFWNPITPVQKAFNYDINSATSNVLGQPISVGAIGGISTTSSPNQTTWNTTTTKNGVQTQKTTVKTAPNKSPIVNNKTSKQPITISGTSVNPDGSISPFSFTPEKYYDLGQIQKNVDELAATNPTDYYTYSSFFNDIQNPNKVPPQQQGSLIAAYNNRLADYSKQRGIAPIQGQTNPDGTPKYPDQINYHQNPDGSVVIQETPQSFFAKHALASVNGDYVQKPQLQFDKDLGSYEIQKGRSAVDSFYKHAMANNAERRTQGYLDNIHQQMKLRKSQEDQDNFLNDLYTKNTTAQKLLQGAGNGNLRIADVPVANSTPLYYFNGKSFEKLNGIGATPSGSFDKNGNPLNVGGVYKPQVVYKGQPVSSEQITQMYHAFRKNVGSKFKGDINDFMDGYINNGLFDVNYQGLDSKGNPVITNKAMSNAALRAMTTKKGQTSVFNDESQPPQDEQVNDDDNQ